MAFENEIRKKIEQSDFAKNNGRVIRTINVLSGKFINVDSVCDALNNVMSIGEFDECLIYLYKGVYIEVREAATQRIVDDFAKYVYSELEVTLTQKGIKLARGFITDEAVEI
ncbi:hypothetical protein HMPREF1143_1990 [Peptoanaerobacter stomatis]|uniref:Uncharacterized protein n=1 Tax=Peptoanaerobacter stomatis TaxID=796937 RepID=J5WDN1_9FIRM|nr:hypothetical protein [Peptoanaerobacter stomatis]EJU21162.1 hypothetical protein HMPREF1143_1990 [Peptoanaerobacter stomatis]